MLDTTAQPETDERSIARKYGLRELVWPDREQIKTLRSFLDTAIEAGRCGPVPKTAVLMLLEYLQGVVNRQNVTKSPTMNTAEYDALQGPYYLSARVIAKLAREAHEQPLSGGKVYESTYMNLARFIEILNSLLDPGCYWLRVRALPLGVIEVFQVLRGFVETYDERRANARAI